MAVVKILVVDDEPAILNLVTAYLRKEGFEVIEAKDGPAGLKAARAYKPDILILDIMLPGMDGLEDAPAPRVGPVYHPSDCKNRGD
jgi:DNA-binding response OmpR family regulator